MAKKLAVAELIIVFVLVCFLLQTRVCPDPTRDQTDLLDHLQQGPHWQDVWFEVVDSNGVDFRSETVAKLQMISRYMGCTYGVPLMWFLMLTVETIKECIVMQQNNNFDAVAICRSTLAESIGNSESVIMKLMRSLELIDLVIHTDTADNRFYQALLPLMDFVSARIPIQFSGILTGGLVFNQKLLAAADSISDFLHSTCHPDYPSFNITATKNAYVQLFHPRGMYAYYVHLLNYYTSWIGVHLVRLGFHYNAITNSLIFDPNLSG